MLRHSELFGGKQGGIAHHLQHALAVAQVKENHAAHIALALHPALSGDVKPYIFAAQPAAVTASFHFCIRPFYEISVPLVRKCKKGAGSIRGDTACMGRE